MPLIVEHGCARWMGRDEYEDRYGEWPCRQAYPSLGFVRCDSCGRQTDIADLEEGSGGGLVCRGCTSDPCDRSTTRPADRRASRPYDPSYHPT